MGAGTGVLGRAWNGAPPCDPGHRRLGDRAVGRRRRGCRARAPDRLRHARGDRRRARPADPGRLSGSGARGGGQPRGRGGACVLRGVPLLGGRHRHAGDVAGRARADPGTHGRSRPRPSDSRARQSSSPRRPISSSCRRRPCSRSRASSERRGRRRPRASPPQAQAVYERKGNIVGAGWAALLA